MREVSLHRQLMFWLLIPVLSLWVMGGVIAYNNAIKQALLGVSAETLAAHGAVSEPTAREMAAGVRQVTGAALGASITGIAGPDGGSPEKPVGLVYIGLADANGSRAHRLNLGGGRETIRGRSVQQVLVLLRDLLIGKEQAS